MQKTTEEGLVRGIRRWDLLFLVLNAIIGAGIFGLPARVYALAGSYSLLAYVACAGLVALIILCFAEVSSRFTSTGGPYLYAREAFGPLAGFQMGFAIANVMDPASSLQIPILSQFLNLFALLIFFALNIHYYFIMALMASFERIPPFAARFDEQLMPFLVRLSGDVFVVALKVGAPITVALLLSNVALGLTARTVPQMQLFIVAMPLKILMGIFFLGLSLPFCAAYFHREFINLGQTVIAMMRLFH